MTTLVSLMERTTLMIKKVNVLGDEYKIKLRKKLKDIDGHELLGSCDFNLKEIKVVNDDKVMFHLIHEINHVILERAGLNQALSSELQEVICEVFATVYMENKKIFLASKK